MGLFNDQAAVDAVNVFGNPDDFAESVTWNFADGTTRTFNAPVDRQPASVVGDTTDKFAGTKIVFVPRHATAGVTSVNKDTETLLVPDVLGGTARKHRIVEIIHEDGGGWTLRLR